MISRKFEMQPSLSANGADRSIMSTSTANKQLVTLVNGDSRVLTAAGVVINFSIQTSQEQVERVPSNIRYTQVDMQEVYYVEKSGLSFIPTRVAPPPLTNEPVSKKSLETLSSTTNTVRITPPFCSCQTISTIPSDRKSENYTNAPTYTLLFANRNFERSQIVRQMAPTGFIHLAPREQYIQDLAFCSRLSIRFPFSFPIPVKSSTTRVIRPMSDLVTQQMEDLVTPPPDE